MTGDLGKRDAQGHFWYQGRTDDLIKSAGYRIGPAEIEETLLQHAAVANVGVIGVPDTEGTRGMLVKACIGPHKQPRIIEFSSELSTTSSGKIARAELRRQHG